MPGSQGSSFIPKQPARGSVQKRGVRKIYVLAYISFVIFFGTVIAAGGAFFYKLTEENRLEAKKQELVDQRSAFNQTDLNRIKTLNSRLTAARTLLDNHISIVRLINAFEQNTVDSVQFSGLTLDRATSPIATVSLTGETDSFNALLYQRGVLNDAPILSGTTITGITAQTDETGPLADVVGDGGVKVSFSLSKDFTPQELLYQANSVADSFTLPNSFEEVIPESEPVSADGFSEPLDEVIDTF